MLLHIGMPDTQTELLVGQPCWCQCMEGDAGMGPGCIQESSTSLHTLLHRLQEVMWQNTPETHVSPPPHTHTLRKTIAPLGTL